MFRDTRLFILACDDTYAPKQYFEFLRSTRVRVHVVPTTDGTSAPKYVLDRLMEFDCDEGDERWLLLDVDHLAQGTHIGGLIQTIKEARQKGVHLALSKPSFEVWLLLHHEEAVAVGDLGRASEVETALRSKLGAYNKTNLRAEHFPPDAIKLACERARCLDSTTMGQDPPDTNTTRVYKLLDAIYSG